MNDRYLFKAKDYMTDEWVIGSLIVMDWDSGYVFIAKSYEHASTMPVRELLCNYTHLVKKETICQCTGLKDKRGTLIWENDIINTEIGKAVVGFDHATWRIKWIQDTIWRKDLWYWAKEEDWSVEVVGNIFDNPELLEVE